MHKLTKDTNIRLDALIRQSGVASRREVRTLVAQGKVSVNGVAVNDASLRCSIDDVIVIDGTELSHRAPVAIMLNKPSGYVSVIGESIYPSVMTLIHEEISASLFPIGRLDADTEGLLILTNSGELSERISRPEQELPKTYLVGTDRDLPVGSEELLEAGVIFENGTRCRPAKLQRISARLAYITVTEGKYHEVKRLIRHCGPFVSSLKRVSIGGLKLDESLAPGEYRYLTENDIKSIFSYI